MHASAPANDTMSCSTPAVIFSAPAVPTHRDPSSAARARRLSGAEPTPASLDTPALARRLAQLVGDERAVHVEFLLHLEAFDRRRAWAEAGYPSLWEWCSKVLHLREGAAWRRIAAMRVLRRFPSLADHLRSGRLCLTTLALLGPVLSPENVSAVAERAAFLSKAEVERLVASLAPRAAPKEGIRRLAQRAAQVSAPASAGARRRPAVGRDSDSDGSTPAPPPSDTTAGALLALALPSQEAAVHASPILDPISGDGAAQESSIHGGGAAREPSPCADRRRPALAPVDGETYSMRVIVDGDFKADLDALKDLLAHKVPGGDLRAVLREAVRCALEKHGKRRGAVAPPRARNPTPRARNTTTTGRPGSTSAVDSAPTTRHVPAAIRREVWTRDEGRCAWTGPDGRRCGSAWQLELDHVVPVALGGPSTTDNLRLACRAHNQLAAEHVFGRERVAQHVAARRHFSQGK